MGSHRQAARQLDCNVSPELGEKSLGWWTAHWNGNIVMLMGFSSSAALEVAKMTTSSAAGDENFIKMITFPCQWVKIWNWTIMLMWMRYTHDLWYEVFCNVQQLMSDWFESTVNCGSKIHENMCNQYNKLFKIYWDKILTKVNLYIKMWSSDFNNSLWCSYHTRWK